MTVCLSRKFEVSINSPGVFSVGVLISPVDTAAQPSPAQANLIAVTRDCGYLEFVELIALPGPRHAPAYHQRSILKYCLILQWLYLDSLFDLSSPWPDIPCLKFHVHFIFGPCSQFWQYLMSTWGKLSNVITSIQLGKIHWRCWSLKRLGELRTSKEHCLISV